MVFKQIKISDKLHIGTHSAVKFLEKNEVANKDDKKNLIFFFENMNASQSNGHSSTKKQERPLE